jgi:hypothetical protein
MVLGLRNRLIFVLSWCVLTTGFQGYAQNREVDSLKRELLRSHPDTNRVKLLTNLAFHLRVFDRQEAGKYRSQAWVLSDKLNYNKGKGWCYYLEGVDLTYQNKFSPALNAEAKAIKLGTEVGDYDLVSRACNAIGINHLRLEDDISQQIRQLSRHCCSISGNCTLSCKIIRRHYRISINRGRSIRI